MRGFRIAIAVAFWSAVVSENRAAYAADLPNPLPCSACFIGAAKLHDYPSTPADPGTKLMQLGDDLYFVDPYKTVWKAGKGDVTDGASIPTLFKPIIGQSFEADYLPAAIMHDHYTDLDHRERSWRDTDRMFYQAMLVNHTEVVKAKTMYYAVYVFGPHWDAIGKGVRCGQNCLFSQPVDLQIMATGDTQKLGDVPVLPFGTQMAFAPADYSESHADELRDVQDKISKSEILGDPLSLDDLDKLAKQTHSDNIFIVTNAAK